MLIFPKQYRGGLDMRHPSAVPLQLASRWSTVLLLVLLCAVLGIAPCIAQAPAAASVHAPAATATAPDAGFLASLRSDPGSAELPPAVFLQSGTSCVRDSDCPPGKLCCRACAYPGCTHKACLTPMNGHCPLIP
jgi:hypothetical protein